jgi:EAL domain-containing protein (putative c-di-GMP-specific phosphodiesterase class I)
MKNADMALYKAKAEGRRTYRFFEPDMDAAVQARRVLELDIRRAMTNGEFELYFQPIMRVTETSVAGFEALLRWKHPTRGFVPPSEFIPVTEDIGLINELSAWVLRAACREAVRWPEPLKIAVNLSPLQFRSRGLIDAVITALEESELDPERLELEITESVLLQENEQTLGTLHLLRELGIRICLDDFGTGYSSLSYLRSFPFNKIKIDRSFVRDLGTREDCQAIVTAIVHLARSLGMDTTAEGVETEQQFAMVRAQGCSEAQGYLFSPARTARDAYKLANGMIVLRDPLANSTRAAI